MREYFFLYECLANLKLSICDFSGHHASVTPCRQLWHLWLKFGMPNDILIEETSSIQRNLREFLNVGTEACFFFILDNRFDIQLMIMQDRIT